MPRRKKKTTTFVVPQETQRRTSGRNRGFVDLAPPPTPRIRYAEEEEEEDDQRDTHLPPPPPRRRVVEEEESDEEAQQVDQVEEGEGEEEEEEQGEGEEEEEEDVEEEEEAEDEGQAAGVEREEVAGPSGAAAAAAEAAKQQEPPKRGRGRGKKAAAAAAKKAALREIASSSGITLGIDEMVQNCVYYFLINQHKKLPIKRSELLKHAMNGQKKDFNEVMAKFETVLNDSFGIKVIGLEKTKSGFANYMIVSHFTSDVAEAVTLRSAESDAKRATLFLILTGIFMMNKPLDEEAIWKLMTEMEFEKLVCSKKEDLQKFLKTEYVTSMYLNMEEIKDAETTAEEMDEADNVVRHRYSWGPRAENEISKWAILKFVAKQFPDTRPDDFDFQFNLAKEKEKEVIEAELATARKQAAQAGENSSAFKVTEGADGATEYSVDEPRETSAAGSLEDVVADDAEGARGETMDAEKQQDENEEGDEDEEEGDEDEEESA